MSLIGGLDIETTGLSQEKGDKIIEVAVVIRELETGKERLRWTQRINPERGIDPGATAVHGIVFEELVSEPTWPAVAPKLGVILSKLDYVCTHNGEGFDLPFITHELMREGVAVPPIRSIDTMMQGRWASPDGMPPNLRALCFACGIPYDTALAHAAEYDVRVMLDCFFGQFPRGFFNLPTDYYRLPKPKAAKKAK